MDSQKRIRANLRLEIEATSREIHNVNEKLAKDKTNADLLKKRNDLEEYYTKLHKQYEQIAGVDLDSVSQISHLKDTPIVTANWVKRIIMLIGSSLFMGGFYNLILHAVGSFDPFFVLENYLAQIHVNTFSELWNTIIYQYSPILIGGSLLGGGVFLFISILLLRGKNIFIVLESFGFLGISAVLSYSFIAYYFGYMTVYDIEWLYITSDLYLGAGISVMGLLIVLSSVSKRVINDYYVLGIFEGIFWLSSGGMYIYASIQNSNQFILYNWANTFVLLLVAMSLRFVRGLIAKEKRY